MAWFHHPILPIAFSRLHLLSLPRFDFSKQTFPTETTSNMSTLQNFGVVVTGSAGHLGHALMLPLPSLGYRPLGIDILPSKTTNFVGFHIFSPQTLV